MSQYIFIPSCEVAPLNSLENTQTLKRLKKGLAIWQNHNRTIIVSGGIYLPPNVQTVPSGQLMKIWLIANGVPAEQIIAETNSRDTYENISGAMQLISSDTNPQITVVSQWQHCFRIFITFFRAYHIRVKTKPMFYSIGLKSTLLEFIIILIHLFDKNGTGKISSRNRSNRTYGRQGNKHAT